VHAESLRVLEDSMRRGISNCLVLLSLILVQPVAAQSPKPESSRNINAEQKPPLEDPLGRSTPHGTVTGFIKAAHQQENFERAAEYLDSKLKPRERQELARKLGVVLDRKLLTNPDRLSHKPEGDLEDGIRADRDRIGVITSESGDVDVLLEHVQRGKDNPIWLFSSETLAEIPRLYAEIPSLWLEQHVPEPLQTIRWLAIPLYRWIAIPPAIALIFGLAWLLSRILFVLLRPLLRRLTKEQDDRKLATIVAPLRLQLLGLLFYVASFFAISLFVRHFFDRVAVTLTVIAVCWLVLRLINVVAQLTLKHLQQLNRSGDTALVYLLSRISKAVAVIIAGLVLLYLSGVELTAVLTGLGVGGLAIGFGAQKTIENLFGGIMVISDKPVKVGDFCRAGEITGTVVDIGLRSTRIRTVDRTVVAIPNGQLAALSLENFSLRDRNWLHHTIGLRYETTADQLRYVLAEVRRLLYAHSKVESDSARARLVRFGGSSLDIEIFAYVLATDYAVFLAIQEDLLLRIMDVIEASGTSVAFPSQTTYFARDRRLDASKTEKALATVQAWREDNELPFPDFSGEKIAELADKIEYPCPESVLRSGKGHKC